MSTSSLQPPPAWRLYFYVLAPALVVVCLIGALAIGSVMTLGAVRAYVGGESLWSKARHEAVAHLRNYAESRDPRDYAAFEQALTVPLGDRRARESMMQWHVDDEIVYRGFRDGGIHPDDIANMVTLFRYFGDHALFRDALSAWIEGDALIAQLQAHALRLRQEIARHAPPGRIQSVLQDVATLNEALHQAESRFSTSLAQASRLTERLLITSIVLTLVGLSLAAYLVMRHGLRTHQRHHLEVTLANRRWELAAVSAEVGLFDIDPVHGHVSLDAQSASFYGLPREPITLPASELIARMDEEDRSVAEHSVRAAARADGVFRFTVRIPRPDGAPRYIETIGRPLDEAVQDEGTGRTPRRLMGVVRDVTQERARTRLAMERDAAEKVAAAQRQFLSRLSHELRTPLNAILGFAQLLSIDRERPLAPPQQRQLNWILQAGQQLLELVEEVLDISKVEAGETTIVRVPVNLGDVARTSVALVSPAIQRYEVSVLNRIPAHGVSILADEMRLQQILVNLLTNGCKYNRPGGHVTLDAREEDRMVCIDVADDGIGLSAADKAGLFQPFMRVSAMSAKVDGTGLGLYTVRQLVTRMGGQVSVRSEPGQGSCFTVSLPRAEQGAVTHPKAISDQ
jgi:signal transduction histidine kinase